MYLLKLMQDNEKNYSGSLFVCPFRTTMIYFNGVRKGGEHTYERK